MSRSFTWQPISCTPLDRVAQNRGRLLAPRFGIQRAIAIHHDAAHQHDALVHLLNAALRLLILSLGVDRTLQKPPHLGEQALRLFERKSLGHAMTRQMPETWIESERLRGPSNSARMMLCQVPSSTHEFRTCRQRVWPMIIPRRCESAFLRSQSE